MANNKLEELQYFIIGIEDSIRMRNKLKEEFDNLSNSSSISIDEQLKRKKRRDELKEIIDYYEASFPNNIKMAYKQLNQLKDSFLENYDESLELENYNKSIKEKEKEIASIFKRRRGIENKMKKLQSDSEGRTEEEIRHLLDIGEKTSKQLKEKLESLYTEVESMKNNRNNINSVIFPEEIIDSEELLEKYCLLLDIDKDSMIELSVQGNDDPDVGGQGKDVPSDDAKGKDVPTDTGPVIDDYIRSLFIEQVNDLRDSIDDAKNTFKNNFKDLNTISEQDLTNFENNYLLKINEEIGFLNNIMIPEGADDFGFNDLKKQADTLKTKFENAKLSVQARDQAGQTPPMPKEDDDPNPDNYKDTSEYSSLMKGIKTLEKNINEAKKYFLDHFEDLDIASADDLNTFESIYLEQINEVNISSCETFLEIINNPELYEESGFNKLKAEADELTQRFEEVKESVQAREQAGQTSPPVENDDKDDEDLEKKYKEYINLKEQIKNKVKNDICLQYNIDETSSLSSNTSTSDFEKFFGALNIYGFSKLTNFEDIYGYLPYVIDIDPSNIDNCISDCHTILVKLDEVIQNLEIQKQQEEAGKGGKDDDDSKAGSGMDIYNNLLAKLSELEALISNTENNIDYYDSTPNNSKTLLDLQTKYNNINQKILDNKTIMPEYLHKQLTSRLNKCKERIDTIDYNIVNPPPKPVEPKTHIEFKEKYVVGDQKFDRRIRST